MNKKTLFILIITVITASSCNRTPSTPKYITTPQNESATQFQDISSLEDIKNLQTNEISPQKKEILVEVDDESSNRFSVDGMGSGMTICDNSLYHSIRESDVPGYNYEAIQENIGKCDTSILITMMDIF